MDQPKNDIQRIYSMLKDVWEDVKIQNNEITLLRIQLAKIESELAFKSGLWGLIAGAIPVAIMIAVKILTGDK